MCTRIIYKRKCRYLAQTCIILRAFFSELVGSIFNRVESHNEDGSGSVVLFIENLDLNVTKLKKNLF